MVLKSLTFLILMVASASTATTADNESTVTIYFRSGESMTGTIISEKKEAGRVYVVFRTESGSVFSLDKTKTIRRIAANIQQSSDYARAVLDLADTPDEHWRMYEWCKTNGGSSKFKRQMERHLKKVVELDPSDTKAWRLLGYIQISGRWVPEEQHYASRGYVKSRGRWIPRVQIQSNQQKQSSDDHFNSRKKALKKWRKNVLTKKDYDTVRSELLRIVDPSCVLYFEDRFLEKERDPRLRTLFLEAVGQVQGTTAQTVLVKYAIEDAEFRVREQALLMLDQKHYDPEATTTILSKYLTHPRNQLVNQAAQVIGDFKSPSGIIPLIRSLTTTHTVKTGNDPGRTNVGVGSGGTSFSTGNGPATTDLRLDNEGVLQALSDITGQNFGYDSEQWRNWYVSEHTITDYDFRRDIGN